MHTAPVRAHDLRLGTLVATAVLVAAAIPTLASDPPPTIVVHNVSSGCFHNLESTTEYRLTADGSFTGPGPTLDATWVSELRQLLLTSALGEEYVLPTIGITPQIVASHREDLIRACTNVCEDEHVSIPASCEHVLSFESVGGMAFVEATHENHSTTSVLFEVSIPGDPAIVVRSEQYQAWMLPWTIRVKDSEWITYDIRIPMNLAKLAEPDGPNTELLDGTRYWSEHFWKDPHTICALTDRLQSEYARTLFSALPGYSEAALLVEMEGEAVLGCSEHCEIQVSFRQPALVSRASWQNRIANGKLQHDWPVLLRMIEQANSAVAGFPWLAHWKLNAPERSIELLAANAAAVSDSEDRNEVVEMWREAGIFGTPEYELVLWSPRYRRARVFLNSQSDQLLAIEHYRPDEEDPSALPDFERCSFASIDRTGVVVKFTRPPKEVTDDEP